MSTTPNMNISLPTVGSTSGPTWASNLNSAFSTVDSHDHSSGSGVQITPAGININADFPMVSNNITQIRSSRYSAQSSPLALGTDLNCVYVSGVDLYYNDGNGNQVRLTQSGNVAGSSGSISGLSSPASASYAGGAFTWQQDSNKPANMDSGSVIIREPVTNGKGATLSVVSSLGADYNIILPQLPVSTKMLIMDSSGNVTASYATDNSTLEVSSNTLRIKDSGVTTAKINAGAVSQAKMYTRTASTTASSGNILTCAGNATSKTGSGFQDIGLTGTLVTSGKSIMVHVGIAQMDGTDAGAAAAYKLYYGLPGGGSGAFFQTSCQALTGVAISYVIGTLGSAGDTITFGFQVDPDGGTFDIISPTFMTIYEIN